MIVPGTGNLLKANADALVNTVNCVGVMGKGVALQFKLAFEENFKAYARACKRGEVKLGQMFTVPTGLDQPRYIINFPTKDHWKSNSKLGDIEAGLQALTDELARLQLRSVALPPLGCGNGGLDWSDVRPLIETAAARLPDVTFIVFAPGRAPESTDLRTPAAARPLTRARALMLTALARYLPRSEGVLTRLEVQKIAYFLQAAGENLRLDFVKGIYGPYANNLNHVFRSMEGKYVTGSFDERPLDTLTLLPAAYEAPAIVDADETATRDLNDVLTLLDGFETPFGVELLSTVHWVGVENVRARDHIDVAIDDVASWNRRKRRTFSPAQIKVAWSHLRERGWFERSALHA